MTKNTKRYLGFMAFLIIGLGIFSVWYNYKYTMDIAATMEIRNPAEYTTHVLIATQGSEFKDAVLDEVLEDLKNTEYYIKVIDIHNLNNINAKEWDAIGLIHTWEMWKAPKPILDFIDDISSMGNITVLTTSGSGEGDLKLNGVDGITAASLMTEVESVSTRFVNNINALVNKADVTVGN